MAARVTCGLSEPYALRLSQALDRFSHEKIFDSGHTVSLAAGRIIGQLQIWEQDSKHFQARVARALRVCCNGPD